MGQPKKVAYSFLIGDLIHFGHTNMLQTGRDSADYHVCGLISDEVVDKWISPRICSFKERSGVLQDLSTVDEVVVQDSMDPTENLRSLYSRFPNSQIILIQNHHLWEGSIGSGFIDEINGQIINHEFYSELSRKHIAESFFKSIVEKKDLGSVSFNDLKINYVSFAHRKFSTKANTLMNLKDIINNSVIEKDYVFTVRQWKQNREAIAKQIQGNFKGQKIVVRSSSLSEDGFNASNAGKFESKLNVDPNQNSITHAVDEVIHSYYLNDDYQDESQILIQEQTKDVKISGVVFTRNLLTNTPYYLINYDVSSKTDTVTSGIAGNKIEVFRETELELVDTEIKTLLESINEIESVFKGITLDIEFAMKANDQVVIFQVRPLAANSKFYSYEDEGIKDKIHDCSQKYISLKPIIENDSLILSDMAFWNPAELIGDRPNYLDYSLFNHLIMKGAWNEGISTLGYVRTDEQLIQMIAGKPYINVDLAFFALLPDQIPQNLKIRLIKYYKNILRVKPELHDKIEFEIVHSYYPLDFKKEEEELLQNGFTPQEVKIIEGELIELTQTILHDFKSILTADNKSIGSLLKQFKKESVPLDWRGKLKLAFELIESCRNLGTPQFSRMARLAFISGSILKKLLSQGYISSEQYDGFLNGIATVATEMDSDFKLFMSGEKSNDWFVDKYGHLRPGTYDITKLPYSKNSNYLSQTSNGRANQTLIKQSDSDLYVLEGLNELLARSPIDVTSEDLLHFMKTTIELREYYKFVYTKNISQALELIAGVGEELGFSREDMSNLDYHTICLFERIETEELVNIWRNLIQSRNEESRINKLLSLPSMIFSPYDFYVIRSYSAKPNYITNKIVNGECINIDNYREDVPEIEGKIVIIEKADPGYDWIFTKGILGLITKYGGAASHMAIRCAEFEVPAAIGCGNVIFERVNKAGILSLDCKNERVEVI